MKKKRLIRECGTHKKMCIRDRSKVKVIDLSADFRIKDVDTYEKWYGIKHQSPQFIEEAVYGLCEEIIIIESKDKTKVPSAHILTEDGDLIRTYNSVSYTHLDVYKRQTDYIDPPRYTIDDCIERGLTYSVPLKAKLKLYLSLIHILKVIGID